MKKILHLRHYLLTGLFFLLLSVGNFVNGAVRIASVSGNWSDPLTWGSQSVPTNTDDITINAGITVVMDVAGQCQSITDMAGGSISGPGTLTIAGNTGVAITGISGTATISCPLILPAASSITVSGMLTISGVISGAATDLIKSGTGKLILSGTNIYDGITTVSAGILNLQNGQGAGSIVNGIVVNDAAQLELESTPMMGISEALSLSGSGITGGSLVNVKGTNVWFGSIDIDGINSSISSALGDLLVFGALNLKANILTIQGASNVFIPGYLYTSTGTGSIIKDGSGELSFGNQAISFNALTINGGKLKSTAGTLNLAGDFNNNAIYDNNSGSLGFNGTSIQNIGGSQQTIFNDLTLNNSSGVTLGNSEIIDGILTLTNGNLKLGAYNLTLGSAAVAGIPSVTNMILTDGAGECRRIFTGIGSFVFPIGDETGSAEYSPITLDFSAGTFQSGAFTGVRVTDGQHPQDNSAADFITRYWSVNLSGISSETYDITGTFINSGADITGNISNIVTGIWSGSPASWSNSGTVTAPNISASGVSGAADFTGISLAPSPLSVSIAANPSLTICQGASLTLTANPVGNPVFTYLWSPNGEITQSISPPTTSPGSIAYSVTVTDANSNAVTKSVIVKVNALPTATISGTTTVCQNQSFPLITFNGAGGTAPYVFTYTFNGGISTNTSQGNPVTINAVTGTPGIDTYTLLSVSDANTCSQIQSGQALVTVDPSSVGGSVAGGTTVCSGTNSTLLTLSGYTGTPIKWQYSIDGGDSWTDIANTAATYTANNLTVTTEFRAVVQSGICPIANSISAAVNVDPISVGGMITGGTTVCSGTNSTVLTLSGQTGTVFNWQYSTDGGSNWTDISNTGATYTATNLVVTTGFRAVVQNGVCTPANSASATVTVIPTSAGGSVTGGASVCIGTNSTVLTLSGQTGIVIKWEYSTNGGTNWVDISNTGITYTAINLVVTTDFRAVVQNGVCTPANSASATVTVIPTSIGGAVTGGTSVCSGTNSSLLTLSGQTGTVIKWQYSTNGGTSWTDISNTGTTYTATNLVVTTDFKAIVQNGACASANSLPATVTVIPASFGGVVTGGASVCSGINNTLLTLTGQTGTVTKWQFSTDGGTSWTDISNTGTTYTATNLVVTTDFKAVVQNGSCTAAYSVSATVTVVPASAGGSVAGGGGVCSGTNSTLLTLSGQTGTVTKWQYSTNGVTSWTDISNTGTTYTATNLVVTTYYRAAVQNGVCPVSYSATEVITINPNVTSGTIGTAQTICYNNMPAGLTELMAATGGTGSYTYQWQSSPNNSSWTTIADSTLKTLAPGVLVSNMYYRRIVTSGSCGTATSAGILITVRSILTAPVASASRTICYNTIPSALSSTTASGGSGTFTYQWQSSPDNLFWTDVAGATNYSSYTPATALIVTTYYRLVATATGTPACGPVTSNVLTITVLPDLTSPVVLADQTICYNTAPTIMSSTPAAGGNGTFNYQWYSSVNNSTWNLISGATGTTYQPSALATSTYFRVVATATGAPSCGSRTSNAILITVNSSLTAGTIGTAQTICYNTFPANLTEIIAATGGTGTYTYQWQSSPNNLTWTTIADSSLPTLAPGALAANIYYRRIVTSGSCGTANSNGILITVRPILTLPFASANRTICYNTIPSAMSSSPATGGSGTFTYQWQSSPDNSVWSDIAGATNYSSYTPATALITKTYYRLVATATGTPACGAVISNVLTITVLPDHTTPVASADQIICFNTLPLSLTSTAATGGNGTFIYQWYSSANNSSWNFISGATGTTYQPSVLTSSTYYHIIATATGSPACGNRTSNSVLITVYPNLTAGTIGTAQVICYNTIPAGLTELTAVTGGAGSYTYQWQSSLNNSTWTTIADSTLPTLAPGALSANMYYRRIVSSGSCGTATGSSIAITVRPNLTAPVASANRTICYNTIPSALTATNATGGSGIFTYQWQISHDNSVWSDISGATNYWFYSPPALTATTYYRLVATAVGTPACGTITSNVIIITVLPDLNSPVVSTDQNICYNTIPLQLTSSAATGGNETFSYQWYSSLNNSSWLPITGETGLAYQPSALITSTYFHIVATATGTPACGNKISNAILITVNPSPAAIATPGAQTICSGVTSSIILTSAVSGTTFSWTVVQSDVSGAAAGSGLTIAQALTATSTTAGTATYTITPSSNGCNGVVKTVVITVNPVPVALASPASQTRCSGVATSVALVSNVLSTSFSWTVVQAGLSGASAGSGSSIVQTLNAIGITSGTATYSITPTANSCSGTPVTVIITVNPSPIAAVAPATQTICSATATSIALSSNITGTTFAWTAAQSGVTGATAASGSAITQTLNAVGTIAGIVSYTVTPSANGCAGLVKTAVITVNPNPVVTATPSSQTICSSGVSSIALTSPVSGATFTWTNFISPSGSITGATNGAGSSIAQTLVNTTLLQANVTYSVIPTANSCSGNKLDVIVTVNPLATLSSPTSASVCSNSIFTYTPTSNTPLTSFSWTRAAVLGIQNAASSGIGAVNETLINTTGIAKMVIYSFTLSSYGCTTNRSVVVVVFPSPTLTSSLSPPSVCSAAMFSYSAISSVSGTTLSWFRAVAANISNVAAMGTGDIYEPLVNTSATDVLVPYVYSLSAGGCTSNFTVVATVKPTPTLASLSNQVYCNGAIVPLTVFNGTVTGTTYTWGNNNSAIGLAASGTGNIPAFTAINATTAIVTAFISVRPSANGCNGSNSSFTIAVDPASLGGTVNSDAVVCSGINTGTLTLSGHIGIVIKWQASTDGGSNWIDINNTTASQAYNNLTVSTQYRAVVQSGVCLPANSSAATITVNPSSVGGAVISDATVCFGTNTGTLTLSGQTGSVTKWQSSINGGTNWSDINNTSTSQTYTNLTATTQYRAVVQNGSCIAANSSVATITVNPTSVGGSVGGGITICSGSTSGLLTLTGQVGTVTKWEYSVSPFSSWTDIANTATTYTSGALTQATQFRAVVTSGSCSLATSAATTVTVSPTSAGGSVGGGTTICSGSTSGLLTLTGQVGTITKWEYSVSPFSTWTDIANTAITCTSGALTQTTQFRAVVTSGLCSPANSAATTVTVDPTSVGGTIAGGTTICSGSTSGILTISGQVGTITKWEYSVSPFSTWTDIANTAATYTSGALTQTTQFRAVVTSGVCSSVNSAATTVSVDPVSVGGSVGGGTTICSGSTSGLLTLSGYTGTIAKWQYSVSPFSSWNDIAYSAATYTSGVLTQTTQFRAVVTSGSCSLATSAATTVTVSPTSAGGSITGGTTICSGSTSGLLTLSGYTGTITKWQYSVSPFTVWTDIANTATTYTSGALTQTTEFRAVVQSGSCPVGYSTIATVTVNPTPTLSSSLTPSGVCSNVAFTYLPTSSTPGTTFNWTRAVVAGISNPANSGIGNPDEYLLNTTNSPIAVTYVYTLSANGCPNVQNVVVIVTATPHLTSTTTPSPICGGTTFSYIPTSDVVGTIFPWTRAAALGNPAASGTGNPNEILINNTSTTASVTYIYTIQSNDCVNPVTYPVTLAIVPAPVVTVSSSSTIICPGASVNLFSSSNVVTNPPVLLTENFNSASTGATTGPNGWTTTNASIGGTIANAAWTVRADGYSYGGNTYHSNDNSNFYFSNSDAQDGTSSLTTLVSPVINTNNYTSLTLDFYDYYNDRGAGSGDYAYVDISINGGTSWTTLSVPDYNDNTSHGGRTSFAHQIINLSAYIGNSNFRFRFKYVATDNRYWAIDNITLSGTPLATATIAWTSNTSGWTSAIANPTGVTPPSTTTYTATYTDPISHCSGSNSVTVTVNAPPIPVITADYCTYRPKVRLSTGVYSSYLWNTGAATQYIDVDVAGIYTVTVTSNGCSGTASIQVADELATNGNFSAGNTGFATPLSGANRYQYVADNPLVNNELNPEGYYGVGADGHNYHGNFWGPGRGGVGDNYMIINGFPGTPQPVVWQETITGLTIGTTYYFAAWARSINSAGNYADLKFSINGTQIGVPTGALPSCPQNNTGPFTWTRFYGNWTATSTTAILEIVDLQTALSGNDFGLDDISFGTLASVPFSVTAANNSPICSRNSLQLTSTTTGGKMPIVYSWTGPNGYTSNVASPVISNIAPDAGGNYIISAVDAYNCPGVTATTTVVLNPAPEIPNYSLPICSGTLFNATPSNGSVPTVGTFVPANTVYTWAAPFFTGGITGAAAGTGLSSITGTLTNPTATAQTATYTITPATPLCTGTPFTLVVTVYPSATVSAGANRTVCADAPGVTLAGTIGGGASSATWTGGTTAGFNPNRNIWNAVYTPSAAEITAGTVTLTYLTDDPAGPCGAASASMTITFGALPVLSTAATQVKCFGDATGAINLTVTGGGVSPTFVWKRGNGTTVATTEDLSGLVADTYTVVVAGTNSCTKTTSVIITQPAAALSASTVVTGMLCAGGATGTITLSVSGGTTTYSYLWTASGGGVVPPGQTANKDITGLVSGLYSVLITDANICTVSFLNNTVTVATNTAPVITTCPVTRNLNGCSTTTITGPVFSASVTSSTYAEFSSSPNNGVATDNCAITTVTYQDVAIGTCPIVVTRTWTLEDAGSLTTTCQQTITITDNTVPVWTTVAGVLNTIISCSDAASLVPAQALAPVATDNCGAVTITKSSGAFVAGACSGSGSYTNTWTAVDNCLNATAVYTQVITITDNTVPVWTTTAGSLNQTMECSNSAAITAAKALFPAATDNCDANVANIVKVSGTLVPGVCSNAGTYTNTWTVTDDCGNVSGTFLQIITITDNTATVWLTAPGDLNQTLECGNASGLLAAQALYPVASDNCTANVAVLNKTSGLFVPTGACLQEGTYTNTWTVSDGCGNTSAAYMQVISIEDNAGPVIHCPAADAISCDSPSFDPSITGTATVIDNCDANPAVTWSDAIIPGVCTGSYQINRTWKATDACGKFNTCGQAISVQDVTPPVITCAVTGNQNVYPYPALPYVVPNNSWDATATDDCSGVTLTATLSGATVSGAQTTLNGLSFNEGVTTVTWTAIDGCGISSLCQFTVTVSFRPVINCPTDISQNNDTDVCSATLNPGFPSLVVGTGPIVYTWTMTGSTTGSGTGPTGYYTFNKGVTTLTWTATNTAGAGVCTQSITVIDDQAPTFSVPADKEYCVLDIYHAEFDAPTIDISPARPDYYLFNAGNTDLDLNPATFADNCPSICTYEIRWRIDFQDGTFMPALPDTYITGQPSSYGVDIQLPGSALSDVLHHITYSIVDCSGNVAAPKTVGIVIKPRPDVIKTTVH